MKGRAQTSAQKRAVIERILAAWEQRPTERLGQFIVNALPPSHEGDPFYVEDEVLASLCEMRVSGKKS